MTNTITSLPTAASIDAVNDFIAIDTASITTTQKINRNVFLGISSQPVGLTDAQTLTNKVLTSPTISGPTFSGTLIGTYTIGGTPTFPSSVVTLTSMQTLTNKTLTSPTITSPTITNATISADAVTGFTTSTNGTVYGMSVTSGVLASAAIAGAVNTAAIASGIQLPDKMKNPYKFSAYRSTNQTISASTWTKIQCDTKKFDTGTNYDNSTNYQFTAPISGFYLFIANLDASGLSDGNIAAIGLNVNTLISGPTYQGSTANNGAAGSLWLSMSKLLQLNASDTVQMYGFSAGTTISSGATNTFFEGFLVSAT
jgi:hypothetical protein